MKYIFKFILEKPIVLPIQYNQILQAGLLNWINEENYQRFLHDEGYKREKRVYKLYSFSKIFGRYQINSKEKKITFFDEIHLYISSYDKKYLNYLIQNIISDKPLRLGRYDLSLSGVEMREEVCQAGEDGLAYGTVQTLSPVTVASTLSDQTGRKKTYYYSPWEQEFSNLVEQNLKHKYTAFYGEELMESSFVITPADKRLKESITWYKDFLIKGWSGKFHLKGTKELVKIALDAGIGARNSIGYGCILLEKTEQKKREG